MILRNDYLSDICSRRIVAFSQFRLGRLRVPRSFANGSSATPMPETTDRDALPDRFIQQYG